MYCKQKLADILKTLIWYLIDMWENVGIMVIVAKELLNSWRHMEMFMKETTWFLIICFKVRCKN